jgi:hypothetical protein
MEHCLCLKSLIPLLEAIKLSMPNLVAHCRTFSQQCAADYCIAVCSLFKPLGQQSFQFFKWRLFEAFPLTREPAMLFVTAFCIFPTFVGSVQCWQYSSLCVAIAIHVFLLASTWARMTVCSWIENAFFFFGSMENESQPEIKIKLLTQKLNKCWNLWSLTTHCNQKTKLYAILVCSGFKKQHAHGFNKHMELVVTCNLHLTSL